MLSNCRLEEWQNSRYVQDSRVLLFYDGPFSQWWPSPFKVNGVEYNCAEQYMMAQKAYIFKDYDILSEIMESTHPRIQKKLGRDVEDFELIVWEQARYNIVLTGNIAKFDQNRDLCALLIATDELILAKASPYDKIWGIGISENQPKALVQNKWVGQNLLGEVLMETRTVCESVQ